MKFENYLKKKGLLNESGEYQSYQPLNENLDEIMKSINSMIAYASATSMLDDFEKADLATKPDIIALEIEKKIKPLAAKKKALADKKGQVTDRAKKGMIIDQIEKIDQSITKLNNMKEVTVEKNNQALERFTDEFTKLENQMMDPLKSFWTAQKKVRTNKNKMANAEAKEKLATEKGNETTARNAKTEKDNLETEAKEAKKRLQDAEDASENDIKQLEGVKAYMTEIKKFVAAGNKLGAERKILADIAADAKAEKEANEGFDYDFDNFSILLEKEEEETDPITILGTINSIKIKNDKGEIDETAVEGKTALYTKLKAAIKSYTKALTDQVTAKKELWDKVKQAPSVTKDLIEVAGGDPDKAQENPDGSYKAGEPIEKWKDAFADVNNYGPLKKLTDVPDADGKGTGKSLEETIEDKQAELEAETGGGQQKQQTKSDYEKAKDDGYQEFSGTEEEARNEKKTDSEGNPTNDPKYSSVKTVTKEDDTEVVMVKENYNFRKSSRIVPTFESYVNKYW